MGLRSMCRNAETSPMTASPITHEDAPVFGIALMLGFITIAPFIEVFAKLASVEIPVGQIATARFAVQAALMVPLVLVMRCFEWPSRCDAWLYLLRGGLILLSTALIVGAVKYMPIADAVAIVFVEPLLLTVAGAIIFGEQVGWRRMTASVVGFVGCLMVIQPSFENYGWIALLPLGTAVFFGIYLLLSRSMARRIHPLALQANTGVAALLIATPLLLVFDGTGNGVFDPVMPRGIFWLWLFLGGLAATVSHIFLSYCVRITPTSVIAPMQYLEIVTAAIFGYFIFGDLLNGLALAGAVVVVSAGLFVFWRERQVSRQARK